MLITRRKRKSVLEKSSLRQKELPVRFQERIVMRATFLPSAIPRPAQKMINGLSKQRIASTARAGKKQRQATGFFAPLLGKGGLRPAAIITHTASCGG
jgi:hypothetical protein